MTHVCACVHPRLLITSGVIWTPYDTLNKFYSCYMAAIVIISRKCGLRIEVHHRNQPCKTKLFLYKPLLHIYSHSKQLYIHAYVTRWNASVIEVGVVRISILLKEKVAWATDKWIRIISNIMLYKTVMTLRNYRIQPF